jgi:hypothetical protein
VPAGVLLEVETVSVEVAATAPPSVTVGVLNEQLGTDLPEVVRPHERITFPAYPLAAVTVMVALDEVPEVIEPGLSVAALRA